MGQFLATFFSGSINRHIFRASVTVAIISLCIKLAAMAKEMLVAWRFGVSDELDAFNVALIVPFTLINIAATSFLTAFIPTYVQVEQKDGAESAHRLLSGAAILIFFVFTVTAILMLLLAPLYLPSLARGFAPEKLNLTFHLLCVLSPVILLTGLNFLWGGVLNVKDQFAIVAAAPVITTLLTVIFLVWAQRFGIYALALALTVGAAFELAVLTTAVHQNGVSLSFNWQPISLPVRNIFRQSFSLMLGNLLMSGTSLISLGMAARLSTGSVSSLGYANKLISLAAGLLSTSLGTATIPFFAKMSAGQDWRQLKNSLHKFLLLAFALTIPITLVLLLFATPLTNLLFKRGAFAPENVSVVSSLLFYLALQVPFYVTAALVAKIFLALQAQKVILLTSAINLTVHIIFTYWLTNKLGIIGIAISTSITYLGSFLMLYFWAYRKINRLIGA